MDEIEKRMVQVLLFYEELTFSEWFKKTINLLSMDKKTFIVRKKELEKVKIVKRDKRKYFLVPRNRRKIYQNLNRKITQFQKKSEAVKTLPQNAFFLKICISEYIMISYVNIFF